MKSTKAIAFILALSTCVSVAAERWIPAGSEALFVDLDSIKYATVEVPGDGVTYTAKAILEDIGVKLPFSYITTNHVALCKKPHQTATLAMNFHDEDGAIDNTKKSNEIKFKKDKPNTDIYKTTLLACTLVRHVGKPYLP